MNQTHLPLMLAMCAATASVLVPAAAVSAPTEENSVASLQRQLAAQKAINAQLHARVRELEQALSAQRHGSEPPLLGLDAEAQAPPVEPDTPTTAIEEALVSKGLVLLPSGSFRLTPSATWAHNGAGDVHYDSYVYSMKLEAGLPWGMSASLRAPYVHRDYPAGHNEGVGDLFFTLSKRLNRETKTLPSLVLRLGYQHDNGEDPFASVPIGYGFRAATAALSAVKRLEPVALYGKLSYTHAWPKTVTYATGDSTRTAAIKPADLYGAGLGVSLAATPAISLDAGLSFDFLGQDQIAPVDGDTYRTSMATVGYIDLGADFVLRKNLSLSVSAAAGVTDDANDFLFSLALPYRF